MRKKVKDHIDVKCDKCGSEIAVNYDDLCFNWEPWSGAERSMGPETEYKSVEYVHCPTCGKQIDISFHIWEYPVGAVNYTDVHIEGGEITGDIPYFADRIKLLDATDEY